MRKRNCPAARVLIFRLFSFPFWISCWYFSNMFVILTSTSIGFFISKSFFLNQSFLSACGTGLWTHWIRGHNTSSSSSVNV
jgi:hypothetical protein